MFLKILYKFMGENERNTCQLTFEQYIRFKKLSVVQECIIIKRNQHSLEGYYEEMQNAINLAVENNTTHIRKLSEILS